MRRSGKRNRERSSSQTVARWEWHYGGRLAVIVEVTKRGHLQVTIPHPERVSSVGREYAADWIACVLGRLNHEERFALLWND